MQKKERITHSSEYLYGRETTPRAPDSQESSGEVISFVTQGARVTVQCGSTAGD